MSTNYCNHINDLQNEKNTRLHLEKALIAHKYGT